MLEEKAGTRKPGNRSRSGLRQRHAALFAGKLRRKTHHASGPNSPRLESLESRLLLSSATVNWNDVRQGIDGFGASSAWAWGTIPSAALANIYSTTTGAGLSLLRSRLGPNGTTGENQMMQQVAAYGVRCWTTPWTPAREYKTNHDNNNGGNLDPAHYQDYANDLANYVEDITRQGVPLYAISLQNEPNWTADYESCRWTAQQFADFLPYVGQTFASRGITTKIIMPEGLSWEFSLANTVMANPALAKYVDILAAHNYGESSASYQPCTIAGGRPVWETEISSFASTEIDQAIDTADDIHQAMSHGNASAYHYWWLSAGDAAGLTNNWNPTKRLWAMGQYSRFVRPGWVRIGESDDGGLDITTFKDPASGKFAIVVVNTSANAVNESFTLNGVTATKVTPYATSGTESLTQRADIGLIGGTSFTYAIAPQSIMTFYGVSATAAPLQAPTNLMAAPVQGSMTSRISLSWSDNSSNETAYTVERSLDGVNWTVLTTALGANSVSYTDSNRAENTRYFYRVKPTNGDASTYSVVASTSTIIQAPSNVNGTRVANGISLTWNIGSGASTGVAIDRSLDGLTWSGVVNLSTRATSYTDIVPGYSANQMYYYRVRNTVGGKSSAFAGWNSSLSAPTSFTAAQVTPTSILLTWTSPMAGASGASIQQYSNGSWTTVSPSSLQASDGRWVVTGLTGNTAYRFRMRLSADADAINSGYSSELNVTTPVQPIWYKANENSGTALHDSFASTNDATLAGAASFGPGISGNALNLSGGYATLPAGIVSGINNFTIATWVKISSTTNGARIFDFGTGTTNSVYLATQTAGSAGLPVFVITTSSGTQQIASNVAIPPSTWTHIAVTLSGNYATLYVNGAPAGTNTNMTIHPAALGSTTQNYLGRSQGADPAFLGSLDDFQIWGRAFPITEIRKLATVSTQLAWYKADESLGAVLSDSSGQHNDATLSGSASFDPGVSGRAVTLSGGAGALPVGIVGGLNDFTIATWVKISSLDNWARLFDFGTGTSNYMFLSLKPGNSSTPRFAINSGFGEQVINSSVAFPLNTWTHIAVTLSGNIGTMYINGVAVGTNTNMTVHPAALGATTQNYLGDSQFSNDPMLRATIDDFRIVSRAYSAAEVMQLAAPTIVKPATAAVNPVTTPATMLSALATDVTAGDSALTYTWSVMGTPPAPVTFSVNGTNAAKNTVVTFSRPGTYSFLVTIVNPALAGIAALSRTSAVSVIVNSVVLDRHIFYNNSGLDGNDAAANAADDSAIDPSKTAWTGQQPATFANYTGYTKGINGIMVDIGRLANAANLSAADFEIRVGNSADPTTWALGPAPTVSVRPLANGSDRVTLTWADNAIQNTWVQVKVLANSNTGLAASDVFCFGNQIGETGNSATDTAVDALDANAIVNNFTGFAPASVSNQYDVNHDLAVDALDANAVVNHYTGFTSLRLLTPALPSSPAAAAAPAPLAPSTFVDSGASPILPAIAADESLASTQVLAASSGSIVAAASRTAAATAAATAAPVRSAIGASSASASVAAKASGKPAASAAKTGRASAKSVRTLPRWLKRLRLSMRHLKARK